MFLMWISNFFEELLLTLNADEMNFEQIFSTHYSDVIISVMASQITGVSIVYFTVCSGTDKKYPSKLSVTGLCEGNSPVIGEFPAQRASNA